jgi:ribonuclease R
MSKKKKKFKVPGVEQYNRTTLRKHVYDLFRTEASQSFNYKQIAKRLDIKDESTRKLILMVCADLVESGKLDEESTGKFMLKPATGLLEGVIELGSRGRAQFSSPDLDESIQIATENLHHALHGDTVKVQVFASRKKHQVEGEVVEIVKRGRSTFVGNVEVLKNFAFLSPDNKNMPYDVFIPLDALNGATHGIKAVAEILEWPEKAKNPVGRIIDVLGVPGQNDTEIHAILAEFELPYKFDEKIDEEANAIDAGITPEEIGRRKDFRDVLTITIDPIDAKDFDDALSFRILENGNYEIGVHIADVTHYVDPKSVLEKEAYERATSVYLVDRVVPMLPERLSNFICSLRPDEEKLTYAAVYEMDSDANVISSWIGRTVIKSNRRFHYGEAQDIIETGEGDYKDEVLIMHKLAQLLRKRRFSSGSIGFDRVEVKFKIDEDGKPLEVYFKESKEANQLIEEFMLLANKTVAEFVGKGGEARSKTFVYRVHDEPDLEKLAKFNNYIKRWGHAINMKSNTQISKSLNQLLDSIGGKPEEDIISGMAIRTMAKAEYSTKNIGHYGLAFANYTHFTSPIRRYPDMMVHRLLTRYLAGGSSVKRQIYEEKCRHSSERERRAAMAERASIKYKQAEYMKNHVGEVYQGMVSGITEWGIYVEMIETRIEGMIRIQNLDDDFYYFDEDSYSLKGKYKKKQYNMGDILTVQVTRVNVELKQIDLIEFKDKEAK